MFCRMFIKRFFKHNKIYFGNDKVVHNVNYLNLNVYKCKLLLIYLNFVF